MSFTSGRIATAAHLVPNEPQHEHDAAGAELAARQARGTAGTDGYRGSTSDLDRGQVGSRTPFDGDRG